MRGCKSSGMCWQSGAAHIGLGPLSSIEVVCYPRRQNVATFMVGLKNGQIRENFTKNVEPQRYSWERRRRRRDSLLGLFPACLSYLLHGLSFDFSARVSFLRHVSMLC